MKNSVYEFLLTIPSGKVVTYGYIAEHLGNKKLARFVGNVLHNNPDGNKYPCYKVVNSQGKLSENYSFGGIEEQKSRPGEGKCYPHGRAKRPDRRRRKDLHIRYCRKKAHVKDPVMRRPVRAGEPRTVNEQLHRQILQCHVV